MESRSLSMRHHGLSLLTLAPLSSALRPPCHVGLLRREFLPNLRLPRRKCKKLRLNSHSKLIIRAAIDPQSIIAIAAATLAAFSAIGFVYLTYFRKKFGSKESPGRLNLSLTEQPSDTSSWVIPVSDPVSLWSEASNVATKDLQKETRENSGTDEDFVSAIHLMESEKVPGETLVTKVSECQSEMVVPVIHDSLVSRSLNESSFPQCDLSGFSISPLATETHEVYPAVHEHKISVAADLSCPQIETNLNTAPSAAGHTNEQVNDHARYKLQQLEEGNISSSDIILRDFVGRELYSISASSMERLDSLEPLSSCTTLEKKRSYSSHMENILMEGSSVSSSNVILPAEKSEEKVHLGYYSSQGIFCQQKDPKNKNTNKGKHIFHQEKSQKSSLSSNPKGKDIDNKYNPSWKLRVYNQLLREGRVKDCIDLLEDLEKNGLLDMDKIYHARFFDTCKSQKSFKEAVRFTRLISNPTLSTFNMLMSVCASSQESEGAFEVLQYVRDAGLVADCKLYTTLISAFAKSGKVDTMFKVFHEMVNAGVEPNLHTYGVLIDGCAKAGQVAKAFGAYGILRSKNVKPDQVIFNALITACGQSGAVDRAFDVLAEMKSELQPIDPDQVTIGALMKACSRAGQVDRAREVYNMIHTYDIRGTAELYTIAINSCSHHGDWDFACSVYDDMIKKGVAPDEMFISALIDVAGHAGKVDAAFEILQAARSKGMHVGIISYSSLMGACSNAKDMQKALELYEGVKRLKLKPTVPMMNALITALCDGDKLQKAMETLFEMKSIGLSPNAISYSVLLAASEKNDDLEAALMLIAEAKRDGVGPNLVMCRCVIAMCLRRFQRAAKLGEPVLSFTAGQGQLNSKWTSLALMVYRETITAGAKPTMAELSLVLGCLQLPHDMTLRNRLIEFLGVNTDTLNGASLCSRVDGFGEYDPRSFSLVEEAASLGVIPFVSFKENPLIIDVRNFQVHTAQVYLLTVLKGLKHRLAAGAKVPNVTILLPIEKAQVQTSAGEKTINMASRISQAVAALLRRLDLAYLGNESYGKIRIKGITIRMWFEPKPDSSFGSRRDMGSSFKRLGSGISRQQRKIRTGHLSLHYDD